MRYEVYESGQGSKWRGSIYSAGNPPEVFKTPEELDARVEQLRSEGHGVKWVIPEMIKSTNEKAVLD